MKNLFTKKKMTDDELHDLLTWNTAAHLELHAFMIEERRIAASKKMAMALHPALCPIDHQSCEGYSRR